MVSLFVGATATVAGDCNGNGATAAPATAAPATINQSIAMAMGQLQAGNRQQGRSNGNCNGVNGDRSFSLQLMIIMDRGVQAWATFIPSFIQKS
jgi:hypothetical protein